MSEETPAASSNRDKLLGLDAGAQASPVAPAPWESRPVAQQASADATVIRPGAQAGPHAYTASSGGAQFDESANAAPGEVAIPAGWYPTPDGSPSETFWDGSRWTDQVRGAAGAFVYRPTQAPDGSPISSKSRLTTLLLAVLIGPLGVHSFYVGKTGAGIGQILITVFTVGIFGWVWPLVDVIMIAMGNYRDGNGQLILNWDS